MCIFPDSAIQAQVSRNGIVLQSLIVQEGRQPALPDAPNDPVRRISPLHRAAAKQTSRKESGSVNDRCRSTKVRARVLQGREERQGRSRTGVCPGSSDCWTPGEHVLTRCLPPATKWATVIWRDSRVKLCGDGHRARRRDAVEVTDWPSGGDLLCTASPRPAMLSNLPPGDTIRTPRRTGRALRRRHPDITDLRRATHKAHVWEGASDSSTAPASRAPPAPCQHLEDVKGGIKVLAMLEDRPLSTIRGPEPPAP